MNAWYKKESRSSDELRLFIYKFILLLQKNLTHVGAICHYIRSENISL